MGNSQEIDLKEEFSSEELQKFSQLPEAALTDLKNVIKRINRMNENELVERLRSFGLDSQGDVKTLRKLLKNCHKVLTLNSANIYVSRNLVPYYVIIDFEATCEEVRSPSFRQEIIEFPAVIVDSKKQKIIDCFQMYCRPEINPKISEYCTELTGITQEQVDSAETFDKVLIHFQDWLAKHSQGKKFKYVIVTDGPWDMSRFLYGQCHYSNIVFPKWAKKWVNLKQAFNKFYKLKKMVCLKSMLEVLEMDFIGRPHCGLDDAKNIARILLRMIYDGANIQINERITGPKKPQQCKNKTVTGDCKKSELSNNVENLRIEAHFTAVQYQMHNYKQSKRERSIAEIQLARKIFSNTTLKDLSYKNSSNRKKSKSKKKS